MKPTRTFGPKTRLLTMRNRSIRSYISGRPLLMSINSPWISTPNLSPFIWNVWIRFLFRAPKKANCSKSLNFSLTGSHSFTSNLHQLPKVVPNWNTSFVWLRRQISTRKLTYCTRRKKISSRSMWILWRILAHRRRSWGWATKRHTMSCGGDRTKFLKWITTFWFLLKISVQ